MQLRCRPCRDENIPAICSFPQSAEELFFMFPKAVFPLAERELIAAMAVRADSTIVELNDRPVGFANFYRFEPSGCCSIDNVIIAPSVRRFGVATHLIEYMLALAYTKYRATEVTASCFNAYTGALLLYPKLGFAPFAVEERLDRAGHRTELIHFKHASPASSNFGQTDT